MPYDLSFTKQMNVANPARYINDCCVGGDVVSAALLPALEARYGQIDTGEEDWGWFMWSTRDGLRLAVDIFTDDYRVGGSWHALRLADEDFCSGGRKSTPPNSKI